jgi:charged multivesicular body protein 4A/B
MPCLLLTLVSLRNYREEHIEKKIEGMVKDAKGKMSKGDKKGKKDIQTDDSFYPPAKFWWKLIFSSFISHVICFLLHFEFSIVNDNPNHVLLSRIGALFIMKRKKLYEQELEKITNVKFTLETQVISLESAQQNAQTFQALKQGNTAMSGLRKEVGIDAVDDVMDEIKEEMELAQEINQAIAQPVDPFMTDEDELLEELNMLETADLEEKLLNPPTASVSLPTVPASKLPALAQKEEDDLRALEAELAGL